MMRTALLISIGFLVLLLLMRASCVQPASAAGRDTPAVPSAVPRPLAMARRLPGEIELLFRLCDGAKSLAAPPRGPAPASSADASSVYLARMFELCVQGREILLPLYNDTSSWTPAQTAAYTFRAYRWGLTVAEQFVIGASSGAHAEHLLDFLHQTEAGIITLALAGVAEARPLALRIVLLSKERSLDIGALRNQAIAASQSQARLQQRLTQLRTLESQLTRQVWSRPPEQSDAQFGAGTSALIVQIEDLHNALGAIAEQTPARELPAAEELAPAIARSLPSDGALVEIVRYAPLMKISDDMRVELTSGILSMFQTLWSGGHAQPRSLPSANAWAEPRYVGIVVDSRGRTALQDLGAAQSIDQAVLNFHDSLYRGQNDVRSRGQALYQRIFQPLLPLLRGRRKLLLSLDGTLLMVPFAALFDGQRYLIHRYNLRYLTSGRDLLARAATSPPATGQALVITDPDFAFTGAARPVGVVEVPQQPRDTDSLYQRLGSLQRLRHTGREGERILQLLPNARHLRGPEATESAVRSALQQPTAPTILHIATHGVFLDDEQSADSTDARGLRGSLDLEGPRPMRELIHAPGTSLLPTLSRSLLLLAGAARAKESLDLLHDGILTATELTEFNLRGTQLVVLSACVTGRGAIKLGQGVYGLRRAVLLAGAETLVSSLWQVDDETTADLFVAYYRRLVAGQKRLTALQEAMIKLKKQKEHPYYWAAFVGLGADTPLSALRP